MSRTTVIVNGGAGSGHDDTLRAQVQSHFEAVGVAAEVILAKGGAAIAAQVDIALRAGVDVIVAGGGDGTVSAVAAALVGTEVALGVLPLGTLNHFAKDLGLPLDLGGAVRVIAAGQTQRIDVGEVNGRVFINNSSLGLYPEMVREREQHQKRMGLGNLGKWPAFVLAMVSTLRRYPFLDVRLSIGGVEQRRRTPFVFIGNNEYQMEGLAIGQRAGMTGACLSLYTAQRPGRLRLVAFALRALLGRLRQARDFDIVLATDIVVESRHRQLRVATDGEVTLMTPPLRYRVRPASLLVICGNSPAEPTL